MGDSNPNPISGPKSDVLPLHQSPVKFLYLYITKYQRIFSVLHFLFAGTAGFEPTPTVLETVMLPLTPRTYINITI